MNKSALLLSITILAVSCGNNSGIVEEPLCRYASEVLQDKNGREYALIRGTATANSKGCVFILGEKSQSELLCSYLLNSDRRDNVNGKFSSDGLSDFAGEQFISLYDMYRGSYSELYKLGNADALRNTTVKLCLEGVDSVCAISPYDKKGEGRKLPAKIIVLDSPYMAAFGEYDVNGLLSEAGSSVKVLSPLGCMADKVFSMEKSSCKVAVFAPVEVPDKEVYHAYLRKACVDSGKTLSECYVYHWNGEGENALASMLDSYSAEGGAACFDAILCDDLRIDTESIESECQIINSVLYEESLKYGQFIGKDILVLDSARETADAIYSHLRRTKTFRLRIAPPQLLEYMTTDSWMIPYSENYIY